MTHLEANVKDFKLVFGPGGKEIVAYRFKFGTCEDFDDALEQFKTQIPKTHRTVDPEYHWEWEVKNTPAIRARLGQIFDNFVACESTALSQLRLSPEF